MIVMPLRYRDATVGVLKVMSAEANKFQKEDEMILGLLSEVVAAAMFHATRLESDDLLHKATTTRSRILQTVPSSWIDCETY